MLPLLTSSNKVYLHLSYKSEIMALLTAGDSHSLNRGMGNKANKKLPRVSVIRSCRFLSGEFRFIRVYLLV